MFRYVALFICITITLSGCNGKTPFDDMIDEILLETEQQMINQSITFVPIPDIKQTIDKKFLFWHLKGDLELMGGSVGNLSTIKRIGDVVPDETNNLVIVGTFGMTDLKIHFDQIKADFLIIHVNDGFDLTVSDNAIQFNITLAYDKGGNCTVVLNKAEVTSLGGFQSSIQPKSIGHSILNWILNKTLNAFSGLAKNAINAHLTSQLNGVIQKLDLCGKLL